MSRKLLARRVDRTVWSVRRFRKWPCLIQFMRPRMCASFQSLSSTPSPRKCANAIFAAVSKNGGHLSFQPRRCRAYSCAYIMFTILGHTRQGRIGSFGMWATNLTRTNFLTGRAGDFDRLRKKGSVGGFPSPHESPYDLFAVGHAGTAISTAVGMARGDQHLERESHVVAVVGDASIVNGMAFEGLEQCRHPQTADAHHS